MGKTFYKVSLVMAVLLVGFMLLALLGGLMGKNMTEPKLGDLFDFLIIPFVLYLIPLLYINYALKRLYSKDLGYADPYANKTSTSSAPRIKGWVIAIIVAVSFVGNGLSEFTKTYNYFIQMDENIDKDLNNIAVMYEKKTSVLETASSSVDGYSLHEKNIVENIVNARKKIVLANTSKEKIAAIQAFDKGMSGLSINVENYPNLKASELYLSLIANTSKEESDMASFKLKFNEDVGEFNRSYKAFPYTYVARQTGTELRDYFQ